MNQTKKWLRTLGLVTAIVIAGSASAHDDATLATMKAPHGGQLKVAGGWHLELMQKAGDASGANTLTVYVTDHNGTAISSAGMKGSATILTGKDKQSATLLPDGENRLKAIASYDRKAKPKIVVSVTGDGKSEQARFTPEQ
jgi:hypothetical protein